MEREMGLEPTTSSLGSWHSDVESRMNGLRGGTVKKTMDELRNSPYHHQFARKLCAAFVAQQQGITLGTAFKKVPDPISDTWLIVAEFARQAAMESIEEQFGACLPSKEGATIQ
jgi:hypothetical protein